MAAKRHRIALKSAAAVAGALVAGVAGFGIEPVRAAVESAAQAISPADKAQGAKAHPELVAEFGGKLSGPQASYVEGVGKTIALQSGLGNARSDFTVTLLNSSVNNAFAIPGGYVYVTRQLTALMNNEAELAGVLGHEVGHVAARHSAKRQQAATRNSVLGALGSVLAGAVLGDSGFGRLGQQVFSQGSQLLTLKFSRTQELEADNLGITYLRRAGYDPRAMATVLESLARQNALDSQLRGSGAEVPQWASTHPDPASRVRTALTRAGAGATGLTNRDKFLAGIDGLTYDDDPHQGLVEGRKFTHPDLRVSFEAPDGFYLVNSTKSVSISGQSGKAEFGSAAFDGNLDRYVASVFAGLTSSNSAQVSPQTLESATVNGIPARYGVARAQTSSGTVDVTVFAYDFGGGKAYHFSAITQAGNAGVFNSMFRSVRRISTAEAGAVKPRRLAVVTVKAGDTVQSLAARMAYRDAPVDRFLVLNGLQPDARLTPGQKIKIVTY
ncbi:M48 family metalloprotease [Novosphingobium sp. 9U]|uniref:M48 family metalloprotease n=1 Tax=Novosphingobium sp. 9U TaxID=2653158 RepID=UPI0012F09C15|nr:M48 family metalloprotease [Novosphingobium sp. 9U]VWX51226.1 Peptidase M48 Ste24p [Novosphingobium sp. 9U]